MPRPAPKPLNTVRRRKAERARDMQRLARDTEKAGSSIGRCPACGKFAYTTKGAAKADSEHRFPGERSRVYECHGRPGFWHATGQDAAATERQRIILHDAETAARYVAQVVAGTGQGPTWAELADAMGWPAGNETRRIIICTLARQGWLATGRAPRSLRPGPLHAPGAG